MDDGHARADCVMQSQRAFFFCYFSFPDAKFKKRKNF